MALGAVKGQEATLQVAMVCLDELVSEDCRYRRLDRLVDWSFVREAASSYYTDVVGRPSIDPIVLVKLMLVAALEGIDSARELCRVAGLRLDLRRFLGYGFHERLPVDQTLSHAQTRRFVDGQLFERLFLRSLDLCKQHGLVEGTHLSVDGFHAEANAALASLRASLALVAVEGPSAEESVDDDLPEPSPSLQLSLAEPRSGPTPKRRSSNLSSVSLTDPDAKLRGKPGQRPHLVYRGQVRSTRRPAVSFACLGEQADGYEGDALEPVLDRARFVCPLASVAADSGLAAERVWRGLEKRAITAYAPPQPTMLPTDGEPKTEAQRAALAARERCKSERGVWAHKLADG
jgi:transposase